MICYGFLHTVQYACLMLCEGTVQCTLYSARCEQVLNGHLTCNKKNSYECTQIYFILQRSYSTANFNGAFQPTARKLWGKVLFADRNQGPFATRP